jgi:hypothetical protein
MEFFEVSVPKREQIEKSSSVAHVDNRADFGLFEGAKSGVG